MCHDDASAVFWLSLWWRGANPRRTPFGVNLRCLFSQLRLPRSSREMALSSERLFLGVIGAVRPSGLGNGAFHL